VNDLAVVDSSTVRALARQVLEAHWDDERGWSLPHPGVYPHLWLWDSCFHAVIWAHLDDPRAARELGAALAGQLTSGLVPHMRYGSAPPDTNLGPLATSSSLTQPPMYGHAIKVLQDSGFAVAQDLIDGARRGLLWLADTRRSPEGLVYIVHPWESGNDHSPRWDDWGAPGGGSETYRQSARTAWNKALVADVDIDEDGSSRWSSRFVVCPAGFDAYVAFNLGELADATGDNRLRRRAAELAEAMDAYLWDDREGLWSDLAVVGGGPSVTVPISDGVMGALVSTDEARATRALDQLSNPDRFGAPWGPSNVARSHPLYHPGGYWRGAAWPSVSYLLWLALRRWGRAAEAEQLSRTTAGAAVTSGWAEYWNPETGASLGARPQSWTGLAAVMLDAATPRD
jgi:hypothetical protein